MTALIRPAEATDAPAIAELWNAVIAQTTITFTTEFKTPQGIARDIADRGGAFLVAVAPPDDPGTAGQAACLGFATYFPFRGGPGYARTKEHSIMLAPQARGMGLGRALMARLEDHARRSDVHSLWAGVSGENPAGVAFHRQLGFAHVAVLPEVGYKFGRYLDLVLMQKRLT